MRLSRVIRFSRVFLPANLRTWLFLPIHWLGRCRFRGNAQEVNAVYLRGAPIAHAYDE